MEAFSNFLLIVGILIYAFVYQFQIKKMFDFILRYPKVISTLILILIISYFMFSNNVFAADETPGLDSYYRSIFHNFLEEVRTKIFTKSIFENILNLKTVIILAVAFGCLEIKRLYYKVVEDNEIEEIGKTIMVAFLITTLWSPNFITRSLPDFIMKHSKDAKLSQTTDVIFYRFIVKNSLIDGDTITNRASTNQLTDIPLFFSLGHTKCEIDGQVGPDSSDYSTNSCLQKLWKQYNPLGENKKAINNLREDILKDTTCIAPLPTRDCILQLTGGHDLKNLDSWTFFGTYILSKFFFLISETILYFIFLVIPLELFILIFLIKITAPVALYQPARAKFLGLFKHLAAYAILPLVYSIYVFATDTVTSIFLESLILKLLEMPQFFFNYGSMIMICLFIVAGFIIKIYFILRIIPDSKKIISLEFSGVSEDIQKKSVRAAKMITKI